jgi:hypothetical protein
MPVNSIASACLILFSIFIGATLLVQRACSRSKRRLGRKRWGYYPSGAALGNALQTLQVLVQSSARYALAEKLEEPAEDDESGGPDDPIAHLHKQARMIRRGEPPERLTAKLTVRE